MKPTTANVSVEALSEINEKLSLKFSGLESLMALQIDEIRNQLLKTENSMISKAENSADETANEIRQISEKLDNAEHELRMELNEFKEKMEEMAAYIAQIFMRVYDEMHETDAKVNTLIERLEALKTQSKTVSHL